MYTITYFQERGRGEISRLICEEAGFAYENSYVTEENFDSKKPAFPFAQVPGIYFSCNNILVLERKSDGFILAQSLAMARYLAAKANLLPTNWEDRAYADMYLDSINVLQLFTFLHLGCSFSVLPSLFRTCWCEGCQTQGIH